MPRTGSTNVSRLGREFIHGHPLPDHTRRWIVELHKLGVRACDISRRLLVSPASVANILTRFYDTGSIRPLAVGGYRGATPSHVVEKILLLKRSNPGMLDRQIRDQLLSLGVCDNSTIPCVSTIRRIVRNSVIPQQTPSEPPGDESSLHAGVTAHRRHRHDHHYHHHHHHHHHHHPHQQQSQGAFRVALPYCSPMVRVSMDTGASIALPFSRAILPPALPILAGEMSVKVEKGFTDHTIDSMLSN